MPIPGFTTAEIVTRLREFQDPQTGLVPEHLPEDAKFDADAPKHPDLLDRYDTMIVNYALECLGSNLPYPVTTAANISEKRLVRRLVGQPWDVKAWQAGHWVDCFASCLMPNQKYFAQETQIGTLFRWLNAHCEPSTGLWGSWTQESRWLQPVNGFYRLTRGTYAQFGVPLPYPEKSIDTILTHAADEKIFGNCRGDACDVLDVVHPLWLCLQQTSHRGATVEAWAAARLPLAMARWKKQRGFSFDPTKQEPGLQGTEMWLTIIYLMANLLGKAEFLKYEPKGVHRTQVAMASICFHTQ